NLIDPRTEHGGDGLACERCQRQRVARRERRTLRTLVPPCFPIRRRRTTGEELNPIHATVPAGLVEFINDLAEALRLLRVPSAFYDLYAAKPLADIGCASPAGAYQQQFVPHAVIMAADVLDFVPNKTLLVEEAPGGDNLEALFEHRRRDPQEQNAVAHRDLADLQGA